MSLKELADLIAELELEVERLAPSVEVVVGRRASRIVKAVLKARAAQLAVRTVRRGLRLSPWALAKMLRRMYSDPQRLEILRDVAYPAYERLASLKPAKVLDAGCGTGLNLLVLKSLGAGMILVGADLDELSLRALRVLIPLADAVRASLELLPFRSGAFDAVLSTGVVHELPSLAALDELSRALAEGGRMLVSDRFLRRVPGPLLRPLRRVAHALPVNWEVPFTLKEVVKKVSEAGLEVTGLAERWSGSNGYAVIEAVKKPLRRQRPR